MKFNTVPSLKQIMKEKQKEIIIENKHKNSVVGNFEGTISYSESDKQE